MSNPVVPPDVRRAVLAAADGCCVVRGCNESVLYVEIVDVSRPVDATNVRPVCARHAMRLGGSRHYRGTNE